MSHSFSFKNIRTKKETSTESSDTCHVHYGMVFISGKFVSRMTCEASSFRVIQLIHTENWTASSVYFSTINGDLLLGMMKGERGAGVFLSPNYITENINVCVSDLFRRALIVTDKFNEERFSYGEKKGSMVFCQMPL